MPRIYSTCRPAQRPIANLSQSSIPTAPTEAAVIRRLFRFNWLLLALMLTVLDLMLLSTDFRIRPTGYLGALAVSSVCGTCGHYYAKSQGKWPSIPCTLTGFAQIILVVAVMTSMTYMAAAARFPLQDARLLAFDQVVGFDFKVFVGFVNDRNWMIAILAWGYRAISWQILTITVVLPITGHYLQGSKYVLVFLIALTATTLISIFVPAIGAYGIVGLAPSDYPNFEPQGYYDTLRDLPLIRNGALRDLDLWQLGGVVTFPSFHAAAAVIYIWAVWPLRLLRWMSLVINSTMLVATPIGGGHFLADVLAGVAVATLSIGAVNWFALNWISGKWRSSAVSGYSPTASS
jgi:hypothetical protein